MCCFNKFNTNSKKKIAVHMANGMILMLAT